MAPAPPRNWSATPSRAGATRYSWSKVLPQNASRLHLQERAIEHGVLPWCEQHRLVVTAYSPIGHGDFPSKHTPGGRLLADIAQAHDATTRQIALAFLTRRPSVFATPKASSVEHVEENGGAADIQLSLAEIARIDAAFPRGLRRHGLPMLWRSNQRRQGNGRRQNTTKDSGPPLSISLDWWRSPPTPAATLPTSRSSG
jgi:hypothetical protein